MGEERPVRNLLKVTDETDQTLESGLWFWDLSALDTFLSVL